MESEKILHFGDVTLASGDIIVIPFSTVGTVSESFDNFLQGARLQDKIPASAQLGEVVFEVIQVKGYAFREVAFCCSVDGNASNYAAVREIGFKLAERAESDNGLVTFASPILGSGAGGLEPVFCVHVLHKSFYELTKRGRLILYAFHSLLDQQVDLKSVDHYNSLQLAFLYSIRHSLQNRWIMELAEDSDFYFQRAKEKFQEYLAFENGNASFYTRLFQAYEVSSGSTFEEFLKNFGPFSTEHKFVTLCGELIAYIDRNAYNKAKWNKYEDKRTLARSSVRQNVWLRNLINYKKNNHDLSAVSPSVGNALDYFFEPSQRLTMLSENHRKKLLWNVFQREYSKPEDLNIVFITFQENGITCKNDYNKGALYSRILYLPEIKELWLDDPEEIVEMATEVASGKSSAEATINESRTTRRWTLKRTVQSTVHSDLYAREDLLNHQSYATSIVEFLTHRNTRPPLTIGIMAPWGRGKTSLMRFIVNELSKKRSAGAENAARKQATSDGIDGPTESSSYQRMLGWLKDFGRSAQVFSQVKKLEYPVVWFNAWKFQKNEQIWAGFAHEIIHQLVDQLSSPLEQEKFWLYLNMKRIDRSKIRRDIHLKVLQKLFPYLIAALLVLGVLLLGWLKSGWNAPYLFIPYLLVTIPTLGIFWQMFKKQVPDVDISKYISQPEYADKMGYLYGVEKDLRRVMELLISKEKPAVIFIDDLDRCAPNVITEVVEAINLFISGDLPDCYFIIGQDAQMVAAALDVTYEKVGEKINNIDKHHGSLGWYFMEKFVQLQFNIPVMNQKQCEAFLKHLLSEGEALEGNGAWVIQLKQRVEEAKQKIESADDPLVALTPEMESLEQELMQADPQSAKELKDHIIKKFASTYDDEDSEVLDLIEELSPYLGKSPRMIKRFVNLYRFYRFVQFTGQNWLIRDLEARTIGRWVVIMIRWPQLVRTIQWDAEKMMISGDTSAERAQYFQEQINRSTDFTTWKKALLINGNTIQWLLDEQLYDFIKTENEEHFLEKAVELGLW